MGFDHVDAAAKTVALAVRLPLGQNGNQLTVPEAIGNLTTLTMLTSVNRCGRGRSGATPR
jgi:hypothetical protein